MGSQCSVLQSEAAVYEEMSYADTQETHAIFMSLAMLSCRTNVMLSSTNICKCEFVKVGRTNVRQGHSFFMSSWSLLLSG